MEPASRNEISLGDKTDMGHADDLERLVLVVDGIVAVTGCRCEYLHVDSAAGKTGGKTGGVNGGSRSRRGKLHTEDQHSVGGFTR